MPIGPDKRLGTPQPSVALVPAAPAPVLEAALAPTPAIDLGQLGSLSIETLPPAVVAALAHLGLQAALGGPRKPVLVEAEEVASVLGVTRWTIYRWTNEGRIPCVRAGRKVRFEIDRVVAALRSDGPNAPARRPRPRQAPRLSPTAASPPKIAPRRTQGQIAAKRIKAPARQDPMDEMARRRAATAAVKALAD